MKKINVKGIYTYYFIYILDCILSESQLIEFPSINLLLKFLKYGVVVLLLLQCIPNKIKIEKLSFIPILLFLISLVINAVFAGGGIRLVSFSIILLSFIVYDIDTAIITKITYLSLIYGYIFVVLLSFIGVLEDRIYNRYTGTELGNFFSGEYTRHTFGFLVQNQIPSTLLIVYILRIIYKNGSLKLYEHLIVMFFNFVFFITFGSRISFIVTLFIQIVVILLSRKSNKKNRRLCCLWIIFPTSFLISLLTALNYNAESQLWRIMDNIFMNRIVMSYEAIKTIGIRIFGAGKDAINSFSVTGLDTVTLDNGYINLLISTGAIITLFIVLLWTWFAYRVEKERDNYLLIILVGLAVINLIDAYFTSYKLFPLYCMMIEKYKSCNMKDCEEL